MKRVLKFTVLALLAALVAAGLYVYLHGQSLIRDGVETYGPQITGSSVAVGTVVVAPWSGKGRIGDLRIGNPAGFSNADALHLGQIDIALALDSLFGNPLVIDRLALVEPTLLFEAGKGGSNLTALQRNIAAFAKRTGSTPAAAPARDVVIHELLINGARLTLSGLPGVAPQAIALADIRLRDIGVREGGVPASEAARLAMDAIMPQVMQALASREGKKLLGKVTKGLVGDETPAPPGDKSLGKELEKGLNKLFQGND